MRMMRRPDVSNFSMAVAAEPRTTQTDPKINQLREPVSASIASALLSASRSAAPASVPSLPQASRAVPTRAPIEFANIAIRVRHGASGARWRADARRGFKREAHHDRSRSRLDHRAACGLDWATRLGGIHARRSPQRSADAPRMSTAGRPSVWFGSRVEAVR